MSSIYQRGKCRDRPPLHHVFGQLSGLVLVPDRSSAMTTSEEYLERFAGFVPTHGDPPLPKFYLQWVIVGAVEIEAESKELALRKFSEGLGLTKPVLAEMGELEVLVIDEV